MLMNKSMPYDAEIEYIESTGTQYIDTLLVIPQTTIEVKCVFQLEFTSIPQSTTSDLYIVSLPTAGVQIYTANSRMYNQTAPSDTLNTGQEYLIETITTADKRTIQINEGKISSQVFNRDITGQHLYLFGNEGFGLNGRNSKAKHKSYKVFFDNVLMLDLIPVRVGTTGYMYDRISGELRGTGDFIFGPDKMGGVIKWLIINTLHGLSNPSLEERRVA